MRARWLAIAILAIGCRSEDKPEAERPTPTRIQPKPLVPRPVDPYVEARVRMVESTIEARGITDARVLTAMRLTPRHELVPPGIRPEAYEDSPLPIGFGLTVSQPYIVAAMTEAARVKPGDKVLEIGTGSGYQAVVLALMGARVYTIELHEQLAARTHEILKKIGFGSIELKVADGWFGWPDAAPFDAIIVTCATPVIPDRLLQQLKIGGRMVAPIGDIEQSLDVIRKTKDGFEREPLMDVRFGPMLGVVEAER